MANSKLNVLVLNDFAGNDANVVRDYLYCFNQHSRHQFFYLNSWSKNNFRRLANFDFNRFDAIILFWDFFWVGSGDPLSYCYVPSWVAERIAESRALKVQFLQDEYRDVRLANHAMSRFGVNIMFSCVAEKDQDLFYPKKLIPSLVATYPVLTGYVPTYLEKVNYSASIERPIDIGYRSRKLLYHLGGLGQEKFIIADKFQKIADDYGFSANISVKEEDRLYGESWLSFMRACRFSLGTESGASVVDFDSQIRRRCQSFLQNNPNATFEQTKKACFEELDGKVVVQTISPRIFEASAFENTLLLHEGYYEGMLQPDLHYISVKKDYSNVQEVVERMKDRAFCERLARNAKEVLIQSKKYSYQSFVKQFDEILEKHAPPRSESTDVSRTIFYLMNYLSNDRLIPHGGVFLSIPHTCDAVYYYNKFMPYVIVQLYSAILILRFICQSPQLVTALIAKLLSHNKDKRLALSGLLKDWRILALLFQARGVRGGRSLFFELQLGYREDMKQLIASAIPSAKEQDPRSRPERLAKERDVVNALLASGTPFSLVWENRLLGNGLPLSMNPLTNYNIYLSEDCVYRFASLNQLELEFSEEERGFLQGLFAGGWSEPTWLGYCWGAIVLCWTVIKHFAFKKPSGLLQRFLSRLSPLKGRDRTTTNREEVMSR